MPELPEVECLSLAVRAVILGKKLLAAEFFRPNLRWPIPITEFKQRLLGHSILSVERRSKYLLIETAGGYAIIHLGMSGNIFHSCSSESVWKHTHARFQFQDEAGKVEYLYYVDPRRFGAILCCSRDELVNHSLLKDLGPEPLLTVDLAQRLWDRSQGKSIAVKIFLMDAHNVVGVGNIYANEALFLAGIHPARKVAEVSRKEWQSLSRAIQTVLTAAIAAGGTSFRDYKHVDGAAGYFKVSLRVYGRASEPCFACGQILSLLKLGGRASYFCQSCQI